MKHNGDLWVTYPITHGKSWELWTTCSLSAGCPWKTDEKRQQINVVAQKWAHYMSTLLPIQMKFWFGNRCRRVQLQKLLNREVPGTWWKAFASKPAKCFWGILFSLQYMILIIIRSHTVCFAKRCAWGFEKLAIVQLHCKLVTMVICSTLFSSA